MDDAVYKELARQNQSFSASTCLLSSSLYVIIGSWTTASSVEKWYQQDRQLSRVICATDGST